MLGLRYFACDDCGTVHAGPSASAGPTACERCGREEPDEITERLSADAYFSSALSSHR